MFLAYTGTYCAKPTIDYYEINFGIFEKFLIEHFGKIDIDMLMFKKVDYQAYIGYLRKRGTKNTSVRTYARAMKVFLRYLFIEGYIPENVTAHVKFPKSDKKQIIPLTKTRVENLKRQWKKSWQYKRNIVIFSLMLDCGLRCGEVVALNIVDIDFDNDYIAIIDTKNNKSRLVPLPAHVRRYIIEYITTRKDSNPALILNCENNKRITERAIQLFFSKLKNMTKIYTPICCDILLPLLTLWVVAHLNFFVCYSVTKIMR